MTSIEYPKSITTPNIAVPKEHLEERIMRRGRPKLDKKKEIVIFQSALSVLDVDLDETIKLYGNESLAKDIEGNIYDLYNFGAVKRIN